MKLNMLCNLVAELQPHLKGARVSKIYQPEADMLILRLWTGTDNLRLLIAVTPGRQKLHLTQKEWLNPHQPPRFCQLLRSRITRIEHIHLVNDDRVVQLDCVGPKGNCFLVIEMFGSSGNMILTDEQMMIIDVLRRDKGEISGRLLLAGNSYGYPDKSSVGYSDPESFSELPENCSTWSECCDQQSADVSVANAQQGLQQQLRQSIVRRQKKLQRRLEKIKQELNRQQSAQDDRIKGDLLLAHLHQIDKGMGTIRLVNMFSELTEEIEIKLDPLLSPQQNAQVYFKKYKKSGRGVEHSLRRLEETSAEMQWLDELLYQLDDQIDPADLETIRTEMIGAGLLKEEGTYHKKRTRQPNAPQEFVSPSGIPVLRGRNNRHNDQLSGRQMKSRDLWFHAHQCPGAHVLLKVSAVAGEATDEDIYYAAAIAAGYSRARHDAKVEVMTATAENVSRPKGVPPGLVTVRNYKTLMVEPFRPE